MNDFFSTLLNKMEIYTGMKQLEKLANKPVMLQELLDECSKAALNFPLKHEIIEKVLMDAMQTDQDFIGLNVKWVRKVLNLYCQVHGVNKENQREEVVDLREAYQRMIDFWAERKDLDPDGARHIFANENYVRVSRGEQPIDDLEGIKILASMHAKQIAGGTLDTNQSTERKGSGSRLKESMGAAGQGQAWKEYVIDGVGIYAPSEEEARAMRNQIS